MHRNAQVCPKDAPGTQRHGYERERARAHTHTEPGWCRWLLGLGWGGCSQVEPPGGKSGLELLMRGSWELSTVPR